VNDEVRQGTGLTVSAGWPTARWRRRSPPTGQARRPRGGAPGTTAAFLAPLPVWRLWGVGKVTSRPCARSDLHHRAAGPLPGAGPGGAVRIAGSPHARARPWRRPAPVVPDEEAHSVGAETPSSGTSWARRRSCSAPRPRASAWPALREGALRGRVVTLKVKFADFEQLTAAPRCRTPPTTEGDLPVHPGGPGRPAWTGRAADRGDGLGFEAGRAWSTSSASSAPCRNRVPGGAGEARGAQRRARRSRRPLRRGRGEAGTLAEREPETLRAADPLAHPRRQGRAGS